MMETNPFQPANVIARARQGLSTMEAGKSYHKVRVVVREFSVDTTKTGKNVGKPYLSVVLADHTGQRDAKCWDGAGLADHFAQGTVIELDRLDVDSFGPKFEAQGVRVLPLGSYDPRDFVASLPLEAIEANWREFHERLDTIENAHLQKLREAVFGREDLAAPYKVHPSGIRHHHNYLGGNVEHVVGIMRIVDAVCRSYPELDRDVVLFGAAVHDLGKLREYAVDTMIRMTEDGRLRGHLVIGAEWLGQIITSLRHNYDFPAGLEQHLVHMVLSHHLKGDWGSPKPPATPEALLLHLADYTDSQTKGLLQDMRDLSDYGDGWSYRKDGDRSGWVRVRRDWE